jgi:hypothetical protein
MKTNNDSETIRLRTMPDITESIERLTASLQQLTAERAAETHAETEQIPARLSTRKLKFSPGVESFVRRNRDYAEATRSVSIGTY